MSVRGDTIVKIQDPGASRKERLRTLAGREVGERTGLFVVPRIVSFDDLRGEIVFERLRMIPLRQALADTHRSTNLIGRVAVALAAIHGGMKPIEDATSLATGDLDTDHERNRTPIHGDFGMANVFYLADGDRIAAIDWSNAEWMGLQADLAPPEIDVAIFLMSLFHRRIFGPWPISECHELARHFMVTYASASPKGLDLEGLERIVAASTPRFNEKTRQLKGTIRALAYRHNMLDLTLFLRRTSRQGLTSPTERRAG